jgi:hypothetical protein
MVHELPSIELVDQVCEACLAEKRRWNTFPVVATYCATRALELVHANLCGLIMPPTPCGKRMFLLVVDDMSRYMWLVLLAAKDEATMVIAHFRARAEAEARCKVSMLRTDRGGVFTVKEFMK